MVSSCKSSVPSPLHPACNTSLYYYSICTRLPPISSLLKTNENSERCLYPGIRACLQVCFFHSARISEILNIYSSDEIRPSLFLVKGLKRSADYAVMIPICSRNREILSSSTKPFLLFPYSYMRVYRAVISAGMSCRVTSRLNRIVTHRSRYDLAEKLADLNERQSISPLLHHKSPTSSDYYLRESSK